MSEEVAEQTFQRIQEHVLTFDLDEVVITFHGGEPLLAGLERIEWYIEKAKSIISCKIEFAIQTNGTLLSPAFLNLFVKHGLKVGLSIDGDRETNDRFRRFRNGRSSFDRVIKAIALADSRADWARVLTGYLAVIDVENSPKDTFDFLSSLNGRGFDILLPDCNHEAPPSRPSSDEEKVCYGRWMADFFDAWLNSEKSSQIRYFEEIVAMFFGQTSIMENIGSQFADLIIVESDGQVETVDTLKMVSREATNLGLSVKHNSFSEALEKEAVYSRLLGYEALCNECQSCKYLHQCGGGYLPHRFGKLNGFINPSVYCNDIKYLLDHIAAVLGSELEVK